jgi:hypothetical protein
MIAAFGLAFGCWFVGCVLAVVLFKLEGNSISDDAVFGGGLTFGILSAFLVPGIIAYRRGRLGRLAEARSKDPLLPKP